MQRVLLPLFPLQLVLLPGNALPLHIFEDRYKEMIGEALERNSEFGIVQAGEKGILNAGCTATVDQVVKRYPDGQLDIIAVGHRRFEIILLNEEKSYLRGEVHFFDDEESTRDGANEELRMLAVAAFQKLKVVEGIEVEGTLRSDDPELSFKVAQLITDLDFRQVLLSMRSETQRLRHLIEYLPSHIARKQRVAHVQRVAPLNGHGRVAVEDEG